MRIKKTKFHNYADYALGLLLISAPWLFTLASEGMEARIIFTVGLGILLANFITCHKSGLARILRVKTHLKVDFFLGLFLAISPFLYGFYAASCLPHLLLGFFIILNTLLAKLPAKKIKTANLI
ncbi:MAG TPA: hypothetical protein VFR70_08615 [Flavobacterium sp.]|nr:hypothetical protein [Flavobacterium sp.]